MGGPVGLLLARRHPGTVAALVMQATALEARGTARERLARRPLLSVFEFSLRLGTGAGRRMGRPPGYPGAARAWPLPAVAGR